jgi:hypothetical protein
MTERIEWRTKSPGDDALLLVGQLGETADAVLKAWGADAPMLADFLNDMERLDTSATGREVSVDQRDPQKWGKLVLSRAHEGGDILAIDPEPYWDAIYYWFRKHGIDPHPMRRPG